MAGGDSATFEIFDPLSDSWTAPGTTMNCIAHRAHSDTLPDGRVLVVGGDSDLQVRDI